MSKQVVAPRIRGFIATNAHPDGCAANVRALAAVARSTSTGGKLDNVLVIGSSTGYGLASMLCSSLSAGANTLGVCFERPSEEERTGSAGWYNVVESQRIAAEEGRLMRTVNGDAFSHAVKQQVVDELRAHYGPLDLVVYSVAAPRRKDADSDTVWSSVLKPIGAPYSGKSVDMRTDSVIETTIEPATEEEIASTVKVMGGEDWAAWVHTLLDAGLLAEGCNIVAYSYVGPELTYAIYRAGTIGRAKEHLEMTARTLTAEVYRRCGGAAWVSVNKAVVTQASAAIPAVALYISVLSKVMQERGIEEGTVQQIARLIHDHFSRFRGGPYPEADGLLRLDDRELRPDVQAEVADIWARITTANLYELSDYAGYKRQFEQLFGFSVPGIDYDAPTEVHRPDANIISG